MSNIIFDKRFGNDRLQNIKKDVFEKVWKSALNTLIKFGLTELPVSLMTICKTSGIRILNNNTINILQNDEYGICIKQGEQWFIIVDFTNTLQNIRFTVAHELGHIFLAHDRYYTSKGNIVNPNVEIEADMFATFLLMPSCVLRGIGAFTPEKISTQCNVSLNAAKSQIELLEFLQLHNIFLSNPLELKVYDQFLNFIESCN